MPLFIGLLFHIQYRTDYDREHMIHKIFLFEVLYGGCGLDLDLVPFGARLQVCNGARLISLCFS
jgi:hypothetical protein